jgi:hypothetical protein
MTEYKITECFLDTQVTRDMTQEEIDVLLLVRKQSAELERLEQEKEAARQALLDKLGITADEAKLLLGGN